MNHIIKKFLKSLTPEELKVHFNQKPSEKTIGKPIPSPRSWEIVDNILNMNIQDEAVLFSMIQGAIGKETATKFCTFRDKENSHDFVTIIKKPNFITFIQGLSDVELNDLCNQFIALIKLHFADLKVDDFAISAGDFLKYLIDKKKSFLRMVIRSIDEDMKFVTLIFTRYKDAKGIDLEDEIMKEVL